MRKVIGKTVYEGVAFGKVYVRKSVGEDIRKCIIQNTEEELIRVMHAQKKAMEELQGLMDACAEDQKSSKEILQAQLVMLSDEEYQKVIRQKITDGKWNAEYAVFMAGEQFTRIMEKLSDSYIKDRAVDVKDITSRLIKCLRNDSRIVEELAEPVIYVAKDLTPSEAIALDKSKVLAIVTTMGSVNSHTAILARAMGIPAIVEAEMEIDTLQDGTEALVNGFSGECILEPDEEQRKAAKSLVEELEKQKKVLRELIGKEDMTLSGKKMRLLANAGNMEDIEAAIQNDAGGIGLLRSEFLYLGRNTMPSEEEQFAIYKQALEMMNGKRVVVRTLDIGADKTPEYIDLETEENPAMGFRAIRLCLHEEHILKTQLRALYRASVYGNLAIMYPMIISAKEIEAIQKIREQVKAQLDSENIPYNHVQEGIMIETSAAALISDELAEKVDFFSIGTNDLTQYALAIDRQNGKLDALYDAHHKAVLRMIHMVVENAHKAGKRVGICGELASDVELTEWFLEIGVDELSVVPAYILKMRQVIRQIK